MATLLIRYLGFILLNFVVQSANGQDPQKHSVLKGVIPHPVHWAYGDNDHGPLYWPHLFPEYCAGYYQSPINIWTSYTTYNPSLKEFAMFYNPPLPGSTFGVHNNGHAVEVNTYGEFYVTNGGLKNLYKIDQFHFHWGSDSSRGSEHTINGQRFPLEMHIVSWNKKYSSMEEAINHSDGLAVLSILFRISQQDNPVLEPIIRVLPYVRDPDQNTKINISATAMQNFLPNYPDRYFRYPGSLTTPHCNEAVIWTVFEQQQYISERQSLAPKTEEPIAAILVAMETDIANCTASIMSERKQCRSWSDCTDVQANLNPYWPQMPKISFFRQMLTSSVHIENTGQNNVREMEGRVRLVNNYRPTQKLNGRTVYRSFKYFGRVDDDAKRCYC